VVGPVDRLLGYALYVDPPLGRVRMTETEARLRASQYWSDSADDARQPSDRKRRDPRLHEIVADAQTRKSRGGGDLGTGGDRRFHGISDMMNIGATYPADAWAVSIHPAVSS